MVLVLVLVLVLVREEMEAKHRRSEGDAFVQQSTVYIATWVLEPMFDVGAAQHVLGRLQEELRGS